MRKFLLMTTPLLALSAFAATTPASAAADAPVCASIAKLGGIEERCDFYNFDQCRATVSGLAGSCHANYYASSFNQQRPGRSKR